MTTTETLVTVAERLASAPGLSFRQRERVASALTAFLLSRAELLAAVRQRGAPDTGVWRAG